MAMKLEIKVGVDNVVFMDELCDQVSSILQQCLESSNTENVARLDIMSFNLRSCSVELGDLIHEIMISRLQPIPEDQLSKLLELIQCITELADFYESRLLRFTQRGNDVVMGRPKKFINIAMVCH